MRFLKRFSLCTIILLLILAASPVLAQKPDRSQYFPKAEVTPESWPEKHNLWVFILAGQSNMAGRGQVEPQDTIPHPRILSINTENQFIIAKEPLHWYEPKLTGLDCGISFARSLLPNIPDSISILLLPTALGGSSISQWLNDAEHRGVPLLSNFREKANFAMRHGQIKGILWHQGESDTGAENAAIYADRLMALVDEFRSICADPKLPIIVGELGEFGKHPKRAQVNKQLHTFIKKDAFSAIINTQDLDHKGDGTHFNAEAQRKMGERYAKAFLKFLRN